MKLISKCKRLDLTPKHGESCLTRVLNTYMLKFRFDRRIISQRPEGSVISYINFILRLSQESPKAFKNDVGHVLTIAEIESLVKTVSFMAEAKHCRCRYILTES